MTLAIVIHPQQFDQSNVCSGPDRSSPPKLIVKMFLMPGEDLAEAKRQRYGDDSPVDSQLLVVTFVASQNT